MMKLYLTLSLKYILEHKLRSFLTLSSIVFGIMLIFTTSILNKSIIASYENMINKIAGKSQIIARGESGSFQVDYLKKVIQVKGVKDAVPSVQTFARLVKGDKAVSLYILGIEPTNDRLVREYELEKGSNLGSWKNSIVVTKYLAEVLDYNLGNEIELLTAQGIVKFKIAGILRDKGIARANGGAVAAINIKEAQELYGMKGKYSLIDFTLKDNYNAESVMKDIRKAAGNKLLIEAPTSRGKEIEKLTASFRFALNYISFSAFFVSIFLIFNTIMVAVKERRKEIGTLRALGMKRSQINQLFLIEAGIIGFLGSIIGILYGIGILRFIKDSAMDLFKFLVRLDEINFEIRPEIIMICLVVGTAASLLAAIFPAREGGKTLPIEAMNGKADSEDLTNSRKRVITGTVLIVLSVVILFYHPIKSALQISFFFVMLIGVALLIPTLVNLGSKFVVLLLSKLFGVWGRLAGDNLVKSNKRTAVTVTSLMIGISIVLGMGGGVESQKKTFKYYVSNGLVGDIMIRSSSASIATTGDVSIPSGLKKEMAAIKDIKQIDLIREINYSWKGDKVRLTALEGQLDRQILSSGNLNDIKKRFAKGDGILISTSFEEMQGVHFGDQIQLNTPTGRKTFQVVGTYRDLAATRGALEISYQQYSKYWKDNNADGFNILINKNSSPKTIKQEIIDKFGQKHQLVVQTNGEFVKEVFIVIDDAQGLVRLLQFMTMVVVFLGVINTIIISVLERIREIGILRAIGSLQKEIKKMILIEAGLIGFFGALLGALTGSLFSYLVVEVDRHMHGLDFIYAHPWSLIFNMSLAAIIISLIAGLYPASRSAKMNVVTAIKYE